MAHKFGGKFSLNGHVNYNLNRNGNISSMYQEQYLTGGNQYSASANEGNSKGRSVNSSLMGEWKVDKSNCVSTSVEISGILPIKMKVTVRVLLLTLLPA